LGSMPEAPSNWCTEQQSTCDPSLAASYAVARTGTYLRDGPDAIALASAELSLSIAIV